MAERSEAKSTKLRVKVLEILIFDASSVREFSRQI